MRDKQQKLKIELLSQWKLEAESRNYFYCVTALAMPPKADYWKYFNVVGVVAYCLIAECKKPNVSLGALPKPGEKKRVCK